MTDEVKLRIVHCFRSPVGGIFRHVRDLAEQHAAEGHQIGILCDSTTGGPHEDALIAEILPHLALGLTRIPIRRAIGPRDIKAAYEGLAAIKAMKPDILHGHGAKGGAYARAVGARLRASKLRVARFYSPHGGSLHYEPGQLAGRIFFALERLMERMTERIVFVSDYERRTYEAKIGRPRIESLLVHNGLREAEFEPVSAAADCADFLYIGMMRDLKGPDVFIDAFMEAERVAGRRFSAVMVGDGDGKQRYQAMIDGHGIGDRVAMRAAMPARDAFALARTVVIPSRAESMPYIVLEAVAAGMPVIASKVGGIPEMLGADSAAMVPPGDFRALAHMMARIAKDPQWLCAQMPALEDFHRRFSAQGMARDVLAAYRGALA